MLLELRVENLLLIRRTELRLGPGLNVITGETGAGKTVLAGALDLLLGGKPPVGTVRPGADEAWVEGVFELPPGLLDAPELADLRERVPEGTEEIVLGRRVSAGGRTSAFVQGRSATAADLRELGGRLVSFLGQHEHRKLTVAAAQLEVLDAFCGPEHIELRAAYLEAHERARACRRELEELRARAGARERDLDLLVFEIGEIEELEPTEAEHESLTAERDRLRHLEALRGRGGGAAEALAPESGEAGATGSDGLRRSPGRGPRGGRPCAGRAWPPGCASCASRPTTWRPSCAATARGSRASPGRLEVVETRLELYDRLLRKHGGSVASVLAHLERCVAERDRLAGAEEAAEELQAALDEASEREERLARRAVRGPAGRGPRPGGAGARGAVAAGAGGRLLLRRAAARASGLGPLGAESVEFMLAANRGVPAAPLREAASGGELSRVMLALFGVASAGGRRRWCSTRSTPGWAARPPTPWASASRRWEPIARCCASPTCPRWPRWRGATSGSRSTPTATWRAPRWRASRTATWSRSCAA